MMSLLIMKATLADVPQFITAFIEHND